MKEIEVLKTIFKDSPDILDPLNEISKEIEKLTAESTEWESKCYHYQDIINELEKDLIEYFKKEYPDRKIENYNLENCTYDYALVILGKLQSLKGDSSNDNNGNI